MPLKQMLGVPAEAIAVKFAVAAATLVPLAGVRGQWWFVPGVLMVGLVLLQPAEIVTCYLSGAPAKRESFDWHAAMGKKGVTWFLWFCVLMLDVMRIIGTGIAEEVIGHSLPIANTSFLLFTSAALALWVVGEMFRVASNVARYQGRDTDAVVLQKILAWAQFKKDVDGVRWREAGHDGAVPQRFTDNWTPEDYRAVMEFVDHRRQEAPPILSQAVHDIPAPPAEEKKEL